MNVNTQSVFEGLGLAPKTVERRKELGQDDFLRLIGVAARHVVQPAHEYLPQRIPAFVAQRTGQPDQRGGLDAGIGGDAPH